ncbi:hypothetical protein [Chryseobacterium oncorhynchi]|uniref:Uncharacterized protein n=1 Tax=Chryseobacterium oncorhynchi TaxID=741074 RepID=A0A316WCT0_9FLAO|nr:hypothetical protein [Chryseobacterium oncorhynchi]PWN59225.1 hypothetical protein C1638_021700 [Chryseobacterium oncorhynchi]
MEKIIKWLGNRKNFWMASFIFWIFLPLIIPIEKWLQFAIMVVCIWGYVHGYVMELQKEDIIRDLILEVDELKRKNAFLESQEERFQSKLPREMQLKIAENVEKVIIDLQDEIEELTEKNQVLESKLNSLKK